MLEKWMKLVPDSARFGAACVFLVMDDRGHSARMQFLRSLPRHGLRGLLAGGVWLALVLNAAAADVLDGSQTGDNSWQQFNVMAQTITPRTTGQVVRVSLETAFAQAPGTPNGTVSIQNVNSTGAPGGTVLGSAVFDFRGCCNQWYDFTFTPGVNVVAGTQYAIVITTSGIVKPRWWDNFSSDAYTGGQLWIKSGSTWMTSTPTLNLGKDFAFKSFVAGSSNQAPTVIASKLAVVANEGTAATNTGTYADPDGDVVTFTASTGTVAKTGTSSGNWTWSQPATDEGPSSFVTVTANDGHGNRPFTTFNVTVVKAPPKVTISGAPASVTEGTPVSLTGSASAAFGDDTIVSLAWTLTKNGSVTPITATGGSFSFTPDDDGTYEATLTATDDDGAVGTKSAKITALNAVPTATITGVYSPTAPVMTTQEQIEFQGGFTDAGALDTHTVTWTFGDGSSTTKWFTASGSEKLEAYHSYATAGTYQVGLSVLDDDGGNGVASSYTLTVQTPGQAIDAIGGYVQGVASLSTGEKNSLLAKLRAAANAADRGSLGAACNQLDAFLNEVDAKTKTGQLSSSDQTILTGATRATQRSLGCFGPLFAFLGGF